MQPPTPKYKTESTTVYFQRIQIGNISYKRNAMSFSSHLGTNYDDTYKKPTRQNEYDKLTVVSTPMLLFKLHIHLEWIIPEDGQILLSQRVRLLVLFVEVSEFSPM